MLGRSLEACIPIDDPSSHVARHWGITFGSEIVASF